ncbi:MAG: bifunctional biotin--[acetyl-CoA-carboxylase] ligase/biotin operon repressor BirA [Candidatus Thiodiazotropha sp.]
MAEEILLINKMADGRFHSGQELGEMLGISRAGVWKRLQKIKQKYGLQVDAVKGRGYRLQESLDLLNRDSIEKVLKELGIEPPPVEVHTTIDSTNAWLMQQAALGIKSGTVCLAEQQSGGKGRHGRHWVSPFGRNLYYSMLLRFDLAPAQVAGLSLTSAIAVLRLLRQMNCHQAGLKWPNDVLWQGRKLAGLLLQVSGESSGPSQVVIGVGLNLGMGQYGEAIDQPWADLSQIPQVKPYNRNELAARLTMHLRDVAEQYLQQGLAGFIDEWHEYDLYLGKQVVISSANNMHTGIHMGIDETGGIRIETEGEIRTFHAGEVSLRAMTKDPKP